MTFDSTIKEHTVNRAITPLRLIFWGGLLCIFDFTLGETTNGQGFKFDVLSDLLGTILITVGVFRLSACPVHDRYASRMKFVKIVSVLAVLDAIQDHFVPPLLSLGHLSFNLFGLLTLAAIVIFCIAMRWFCETNNLNGAARSWSTTTVLFVTIYLIPLGLFYILGSLASLSGASFDLNLGPVLLLVLPVFAVPLIHLFISTSRMKRAAELWVPLNESRDVTGYRI
jgi:hypothetical protein